MQQVFHFCIENFLLKLSVASAWKIFNWTFYEKFKRKRLRHEKFSQLHFQIYLSTSSMNRGKVIFIIQNIIYACFNFFIAFLSFQAKCCRVCDALNSLWCFFFHSFTHLEINVCLWQSKIMLKMESWVLHWSLAIKRNFSFLLICYLKATTADATDVILMTSSHTWGNMHC